jgi:hypothetical protein
MREFVKFSKIRPYASEQKFSKKKKKLVQEFLHSATTTGSYYFLDKNNEVERFFIKHFFW